MGREVLVVIPHHASFIDQDIRIMESEFDVVTPYLHFVTQTLGTARRLKVVVDAGNGTAGAVAPRLLRALGYPRLVLPTHWDRFNVGYEVSQEPAIERLQSFLAEVKKASPNTTVIVPKYFQPIPVP